MSMDLGSAKAPISTAGAAENQSSSTTAGLDWLQRAAGKTAEGAIGVTWGLCSHSLPVRKHVEQAPSF